MAIENNLRKMSSGFMLTRDMLIPDDWRSGSVARFSQQRLDQYQLSVDRLNRALRGKHSPRKHKRLLSKQRKANTKLSLETARKQELSKQAKIKQCFKMALKKAAIKLRDDIELEIMRFHR